MTNTKILFIGLFAGLFFSTAGIAHALGVSKKVFDHNTVDMSGTCKKDVQIYLYDTSGTVVYNAGTPCKGGVFSFVDQIDKWNLPDNTYTVVTFETGDAPDKTHGTDFVLDRKEIIHTSQNASSSVSADTQVVPVTTQDTSDGTVSGNLRVKGDGLFEGLLHVIDTVLTKNIIVDKVAQFFGDVFFKGNVFFSGRPTFNSDTAGFAVIKQGASKVTVTFDSAYDTTPIVNATLKADSDTSTVVTAGYSYIIANQTPQGFTIVLNKPASEDITFSWTSIAVSNAKTSQSQ